MTDESKSILKRTELKQANLQIRMPHSLLDRLTVLAKAKDIKRQELIRQLLKVALDLVEKEIVRK